MAIQYSGGTYIDFSFATTTKADLLTNLQTQLTAAGWTVVSGGGSNNILLQSAQAAGSNNQGRVRLADNGGVGIQVTLENVSGTAKQTQDLVHGGTLKPGPTYRLLATRYQFFCFPSTGATLSGQFVGAGILYIPAFLQGVVTEAFYLSSNSHSDTDTNTPPSASFRTSLTPSVQNQGSVCGNFCTVVNGNLLDFSNGYTSVFGHLTTVIPTNAHTSSYSSSSFIPAYRWHDFSLQIAEVLVAYGTADSGDEPLLRGQLYDACYISDVFPQNATTSFNDNGATHAFYALCSTAGNADNAHGSLFIATS